jgi:micrococcal nuclease
MKAKVFSILFGLLIAILMYQATLVSAHSGGRDELGGHFRNADCSYLLHSPTSLAKSAKNINELITLIKQNNSNSKCVNNLSESTIDLEGFTFSGGTVESPNPTPSTPAPKPKAIAPKTVTLQVGKKYPASLEKCVDGDTAHFKVNGQVYKTRFLYIDTPESTNQQEPYGKDAANFTCDFINNGKITLQTDGSELYDKYDRLLAWVWVDGKLHQEEITKAGFVEDFYDFGTYQYEDRVIEAMEYARENYFGMYVGNKPKETEKKENEKENTNSDSKATTEKAKTHQDKNAEKAVPVSKEESETKEASMEATNPEEKETSSSSTLFILFMIFQLFFMPAIFNRFGVKPLIVHRLIAKKRYKNILLFFLYSGLFFITIPLIFIEWIRFVVKKTRKVSAV